MRIITTEIAIAAPPGRVWEVLMDFDTYPEWNPFITVIAGDPAPDGRLDVSISPPGGKSMRFRPTVAAHEPERFFQWLGSLGMRGVFDGRHSFRLSPTEHGTRFEHREDFTGLLSFMMSGSRRDQTEAGFEAMNRALKARCES
jgi:hypothetical protein